MQISLSWMILNYHLVLKLKCSGNFYRVKSLKEVTKKLSHRPGRQKIGKTAGSARGQIKNRSRLGYVCFIRRMHNESANDR